MARNNRNYKEFSVLKLSNNFAAFIGYILIFRSLNNGTFSEDLIAILNAAKGIFVMIIYKLFDYV